MLVCLLEFVHNLMDRGISCKFNANTYKSCVTGAGQDFYVIALADATVPRGALAGRLQQLGSHVREDLSQLD